MVPVWNGNNHDWKRIDLAFRPNESSGSRDIHSETFSAEGQSWASSSGQPIDIVAIEHLGVAFGMDTNVGTIWLQWPGQNHFPR